MSYDFPVNIDQDILEQYREELAWTNQEVEMLAIDLERNPENLKSVEQVRQLIYDAWLSSVKLDLIPLSESLADTLKGVDLLLDWQLYPPRMTEFVLTLLDRMMVIANEVEQSQIIDMRKTQTILVALQYILLAADAGQVDKGIESALDAINRAPSSVSEFQGASDEIELFGEQEADIELFGEQSASDVKPHVDIFVPEKIDCPVSMAREFIEYFKEDNCFQVVDNIRDGKIQHTRAHTQTVLELALSINFLAGEPVCSRALFQGICLHDIALASMQSILKTKDRLTEEDIEDMQMHPYLGAQLAFQLAGSEDVKDLVLHHHENLDSSGYPYGLSSGSISDLGKLAAVVDTFHNAVEQHSNLPFNKRILKGVYDVNVGVSRRYDPAWVSQFNNAVKHYWLSEWSRNAVA
ncbi:MAG: HD domain-containing protein [Gammaproteobacteria bacterium]|nr:HD domain-containing protein [Gammaproteobacteria bacterium]